MASLGSVISTALTGEDSPVFQSAPKEFTALAKQSADTSTGVAEVNAKVDALTEAFTAFLAAQTAGATDVVTRATAKEPTKAKSETPTKDPEGKLDPADEKVGSKQKAN